MVLTDAKALFNAIYQSLSCAELDHAPLIPYGGETRPQSLCYLLLH